jgi:hypothetical protein
MPVSEHLATGTDKRHMKAQIAISAVTFGNSSCGSHTRVCERLGNTGSGHRYGLGEGLRTLKAKNG